MNQIETLIIGGGQAGLATSYYLKQRGRENVVLEKAALPAQSWRNDRWDSFTLVTPNWTFQLPGGEYDGNEPEGFMGRDEIVHRFEQYVTRHQLPVQFNSEVMSIEQNTDGLGFIVQTMQGALDAKNVVVATGLFQRPKTPSFAASLSPKITQLHSGQYRNPNNLPPGAVLVVGSGQSGCQIAEELCQSGRHTYLSVGSAGRVPRRY